MELATYRQAQDFEAAKRNSPYYAVADFATFQGGTALVVGFRDEGFSGSLLSIFGDSNVPFEALIDNRPLITTPRKGLDFDNGHLQVSRFRMMWSFTLTALPVRSRTIP